MFFIHFTDEQLKIRVYMNDWIYRKKWVEFSILFHSATTCIKFMIYLIPQHQFFIEKYIILEGELLCGCKTKWTVLKISCHIKFELLLKYIWSHSVIAEMTKFFD